MRIYLDNNASTPMADEVRQALMEVLEVGGNPSSIHSEGRIARQHVERGRRRVATLIGGLAEEMVFTSGGTEADCLGIIGLVRAVTDRSAGGGLAESDDGKIPVQIVCADIEHPAVLGCVGALASRGHRRVQVPVDAHGRIDMDAVAHACAQAPSVVALSLANHELGTVQDVTALASVTHAHGGLLHCDAVQAAGKIPIDVAELGADTVALSAHKFYGPKGVGALWVRRDLDLAPLYPAGHQERERRPGTENLLGIVGMGCAAQLVQEHGARWSSQIGPLTERLQQGLQRMDGARIHGDGGPRIGNTVNAAFAGALGETVVAALDLAGISASTGAACTSGSVEPSPALLALGLPPERAREAVRFSLGKDTTAADIEAVLAALPEIVERARRFR